jgi:pimeloyl-ACP methyl ester carboxylesterase
MKPSLVALTGLMVIGCSNFGSPGATAPTSTPSGSPTEAVDLPSAVEPGFYVPPDPLPPGKAGDIVRSQQIRAPGEVRVWTVLYRSTGLDGEPTTISGTIAAPQEHGVDHHRIISWGHGTTGLIDSAAPSRGGQEQIEAMTAFVRKGYVVAATDYEGLGTPGPHPYIVGVSEGRSMLDAARAARSLLGSHQDDAVIMVGHSQGGHAALFAGELASAYAPDLFVISTVAFAPGGDLVLLSGSSTSSSASEDAHRNALMVMASWHEVYGLPLVRLLSPAGLAIAAALLDETGPMITLPDERLFLADPASDPAWRARLLENSPGHPSPTAAVPPILIFQGTADDQATAASTKSVTDAYCAAKVVVELRIFSGDDHGSIMENHFGEWLAESLSSAPLRSSCGS